MRTKIGGVSSWIIAIGSLAGCNLQSPKIPQVCRKFVAYSGHWPSGLLTNQSRRDTVNAGDKSALTELGTVDIIDGFSQSHGHLRVFLPEKRSKALRDGICDSRSADKAGGLRLIGGGVMCVNDALTLAHDKARIYCEESELWKKDHALAMAYYDFRDFLEFGISIFDSITKIDEDWRLRVLKHEFDYDPAVSAKILAVYKMWLEPCDEIERALLFVEKEFGNVANAAEFRSRCREARGILTTDNQFFAGDSLVSLCDAAIIEKRNGEAFDVGGPR
jgi:hypothetical protein